MDVMSTSPGPEGGRSAPCSECWPGEGLAHCQQGDRMLHSKGRKEVKNRYTQSSHEGAGLSNLTGKRGHKTFRIIRLAKS